MKRLLGLALATFAAALAFAAPSNAEEIYLQSTHSGRYVGESGGLLAANARAASGAVRLEIVRLQANRVAFRIAGGNSYVRAGVGQQTYLQAGSPHIRGWEMFRMSRLPGGSVAIRSEQNGKLVRAGVGHGSLLAAVSDGRPQAWERFRIVPASAVAQPQGGPFAVSTAITGVWRVRHVAAHQTGYLTELSGSPRLCIEGRNPRRRRFPRHLRMQHDSFPRRAVRPHLERRLGHDDEDGLPNLSITSAERSLAKATEDAVRVGLDGDQMTLRDSAEIAFSFSYDNTVSGGGQRRLRLTGFPASR